MLRHKHRLQKYLFQRPDGTLCYYFTQEYITHLMTTTKLSEYYTIIEMKYACVKNINRKKNLTMKRVFMHLVLQKK